MGWHQQTSTESSLKSSLLWERAGSGIRTKRRAQNHGPLTVYDGCAVSKKNLSVLSLQSFLVVDEYHLVEQL